MKNVLVTGGAGFIGTNFVYDLAKKDPTLRVVVLDSLTYAGRKENLNRLPMGFNWIFAHGNICSRDLVEKLLREYSIDTVVHFAAESHVDRGIKNPDLFIQTNIVGTFTLLESLRAVSNETGQAIRFHHVSTDEVFGALAPGDPAFNEATPYAPRSPYSASKASSDHLVRAYWTTYGLPITISSCSNNYGPYQFPEKLIPLVIVNALAGKALPVYGKGDQIRDWLYVEDHCDAIYRIADQGTPGETYCIGGGNQPTNLSIVKSICSILDRKRPRANGASYADLITFVQDRPGHDFRYDIDSGKIRRTLGWTQKHCLEEGLAATVDWYLSNSAWLSGILSGKAYSDWVERNYSGRGNAGETGAGKTETEAPQR